MSFDLDESSGKLTEAERTRLLHVFDDVMPRIPQRPLDEVQKELDEIRRARGQGGHASGPSPH